MSTTPVPVLAVPLSQIVSKDISWLKQHETLLIVLMVLLVGTFVVYKYFDLAANIEDHKAQQAQATLTVQTQKDAATLVSSQQALASYQTTIAQTLAANTALANAVASRNTQVIVQQATDKTLPPTALATRWSGLVNDPGVTPSVEGYTLSASAGLATVTQLEQVPVLQLDLMDETTKATNLQSDVDKANGVIADGKTLVIGLQAQLVDQSKADAATLKAVKANARKGKMKSFFVGFGIGFASGVTAHLW